MTVDSIAIFSPFLLGKEKGEKGRQFLNSINRRRMEEKGVSSGVVVESEGEMERFPTNLRGEESS